MYRFKKTFLVIFIIINLFLIGIAWSVSEEGYAWFPQKKIYFLFAKNDSPIVIQFCERHNWPEIIKREFNDDAYANYLGFTVRKRNRNGERFYWIYIVYSSDGTINLDTLGHEIGHVLDGSWHK